MHPSATERLNAELSGSSRTCPTVRQIPASNPANKTNRWREILAGLSATFL
jgi:hypothetical protein